MIIFFNVHRGLWGFSPQGQRWGSVCSPAELWWDPPLWRFLSSSSSTVWWAPSPAPPAHGCASPVCLPAECVEVRVSFQTGATFYPNVQRLLQLQCLFFLKRRCRKHLNLIRIWIKLKIFLNFKIILWLASKMSSFRQFCVHI